MNIRIPNCLKSLHPDIFLIPQSVPLRVYVGLYVNLRPGAPLNRRGVYGARAGAPIFRLGPTVFCIPW